MAYEVHNGSIFSQGIWAPRLQHGGSSPAAELFNQGVLQSYSPRFQDSARNILALDPSQMPVGVRPQLQSLRSCPVNTDVALLPPVQAGELISGVGVLTWLSSKAGLITAKGNKFTVSFQLKDFCDQGVSDLTAVLRPGFTLSFQALASESNDWIATNVSPLHGVDAENEFFGAVEVDLEAAEATLSCGPPRLAKDTYSVELELRAIPVLLSIFQRHGLPHCQLSSLHSQISNCGDEELYRYIGTSSLKRRQYLERRTHLFIVSAGDQVCLQQGAIYQAVTSLARYLLCRGGATSTQSLYEYFSSCPEIQIETRKVVGEGRAAFLSLILSHPWIFALFPARNFLSIRRNLPHYDYCGFLNQFFPDSDLVGRRFSPPPNSLKVAHNPLGGMAPSSIRPITGASALSNAMLPSGAPMIMPLQAVPNASSPTVALSNSAQIAVTRAGGSRGTPSGPSTGNSWNSLTAGAFIDSMPSGIGAPTSDGAFPGVWPLAACNSAPFWAQRQGSLPAMPLPEKRFMVNAATQTDCETKVDRACGPDHSVRTECVCGFAAGRDPGFAEPCHRSVSAVPNQPSPLSDILRGVSAAVGRGSDDCSPESCVFRGEERLYNPFQSFLPCDLAGTTNRFSALNL